LATAATNITAVNNIDQIEEERRRFAAFGIEYEVWGPEQLYERLRTSPATVHRFLGEYGVASFSVC